jgi:hypothetical protein
MKRISYITLFFLLGAIGWWGCDKKEKDFQNFFNGHEITYPATVAKVGIRTGNYRTMLYWNPSPDPAVKKYVIYWNNKKDSVMINGIGNNPADTVKALITNLSEYVYSFTVVSLDDAGNRSVPVDVNNVRVYGDIYKNGLLNRGYNGATPYTVDENGKVKIYFNTPDTINIATRVKYTGTDNNTHEVLLSPADSVLAINDYKLATPILYRSNYIPEKGSIDTFLVTKYDTFPTIYTYVACDKSKFQEVHLANDAGTYESGTSISKLWDGSQGPQGYPNIFHSDGDHKMPHTITFDMGMVYNNLARIEETGRNCCNNPDVFEVWGIADITNAATALPSNDNGWKAEAISKGWILLKEVTRTDDGAAPFKADLMNNPPPVRYIRLRIKHVVSGNDSYSNISELTFWNKQ